jgi:hypothetical protein
MTLAYTLKTMILDQIVVTVIMDTTAASDNIVVFVIPLVALLTSTPVMCRQQHLWNSDEVQTVHHSKFSSFVIKSG